MANTTVSVLVPKGEYIDLYGAAGIPPGAVLLVANIGDSPVRLATADEQPPVDSRAYQVLEPRGLPMKNDGGGFEWAFSANQTGRLNVRAF